MKTTITSIIVILSFVVIVSCSKEKEAVTTTTNPATVTTNTTTGTTNTVTYGNTVHAIITQKCTTSGCHVGGHDVFDLRTYSLLKARVDNGTFKSRVLTDKSMPPYGSSQLSADNIQKITAWLDSGAHE